MGKVYEHPERSKGFLVVSDPDPRVDEPPEPDDGEVLTVDFEQNYLGGEHHWRRCQECPRTFRYDRPPLQASVYLEGSGAVGGRFVNAMFCSRKCWTDRAGEG